MTHLGLVPVLELGLLFLAWTAGFVALTWIFYWIAPDIIRAEGQCYRAMWFVMWPFFLLGGAVAFAIILFIACLDKILPEDC